jgi:hypothetical protein
VCPSQRSPRDLLRRKNSHSRENTASLPVTKQQRLVADQS